MRPAGPNVAVDGPTGLWTEGHGATLSAFSAPDDRHTRLEVHIPDLHGHDLPRPGAGLDHQPDDRLVTTVTKVPPRAGLDQQPALIIVKLLHYLVVELRRLEVAEPIGVDLALLREPGLEAAHCQLP